MYKVHNICLFIWNLSSILSLSFIFWWIQGMVNELKEAGLFRIMHSSENMQATSRRQARQHVDNERNCPCFTYVESDNFTSSWNKFRGWKMVQGDLSSWKDSVANPPFLLQCALRILAAQGTHKQGWITVAVAQSGAVGVVCFQLRQLKTKRSSV